MGAVHSKTPKIGDKVVKASVEDRYVVLKFESGISISVYAGSPEAAALLAAQSNSAK